MRSLDNSIARSIGRSVARSLDRSITCAIAREGSIVRANLHHAEGSVSACSVVRFQFTSLAIHEDEDAQLAKDEWEAAAAKISVCCRRHR